MIQFISIGALHRANRLAEAGFAVACALLCSQFAAFLGQYMQNLAGRLDESQRDVAGIVARAFQADLPVYAYVRYFKQSGDPIFVREGHALQAKIDRAAELADAHNAILRAGLVEKPLAFLTHLDPVIAADTWRHFAPALPLDAASLVYAAMGLVLALLAWELAAGLLRLPLRLVRRRRGAPPGPPDAQEPVRSPRSGAEPS